MRQKPPILNCNNSISSNICRAANVNAAATAATKCGYVVAAKADTNGFVLQLVTCLLKFKAADVYQLKAKLHCEIEESEEFCEDSADCSPTFAPKNSSYICCFCRIRRIFRRFG